MTFAAFAIVMIIHPTMAFAILMLPMASAVAMMLVLVMVLPVVLPDSVPTRQHARACDDEDQEKLSIHHMFCMCLVCGIVKMRAHLFRPVLCGTGWCIDE